MNSETCFIISSGKNWMEQAAIDQLKGVSKLAGAVRAVGLPDLHPGRIPVGMAVLTRGRFYPHLIGNDIGCGMSLYKTGVKRKRVRPDHWVSRLNSIRELGDIPWESPYEEECPIHDFGTIGTGNHFAEFQRLDKVYDSDAAEYLGLTDDPVFLLIHSGSRGYGQDILSRFYTPEGIEEGTQRADSYLREHDRALLWAGRNRLASARKLLKYLNVDDQAVPLIESCHNYVERREDGWLHRKGSVSAKQGAVVIPGSRGSLTYVCIPREDTAISLDSLSHGAGRKWARSICKSRIDRKYDRNTIRATKFKSQVVCHDTNLLFEEAPEAYKSVEQVIGSLQEFGLIDVAATLRPLITYKG